MVKDYDLWLMFGQGLVGSDERESGDLSEYLFLLEVSNADVVTTKKHFILNLS